MDITPLITIDMVKAFALLHNLHIIKLARFIPYASKEEIGNLYRVCRNDTEYSDSLLFLGMDTGHVSVNSRLINKSNVTPITQDEFYIVIGKLIS